MGETVYLEGGFVTYRPYVYAVVAKDVGHCKRLDGITDLRNSLLISQRAR